jgi:hypothetical protein
VALGTVRHAGWANFVGLRAFVNPNIKGHGRTPVCLPGSDAARQLVAYG